MALDPTLEIVGALGNRLAQAHYATTTDADGFLPWLPTDADRQALVDELGRAPTLKEERFFESGYRESMLRLDGNAHSPLLSGPFWHEFTTLLGRYGFPMPAEGTPERVEAQRIVMRALRTIKGEIAQLGLPAPSNLLHKEESDDRAVGT